MAEILTYGCRLNTYESECVRKILTDLETEDLIVINSCAVTNEVERQIKQKIRQIHRKEPEKRMVVMGCASHLSPESYIAMPGVVKVLNNEEKLKRSSYTDILQEKPGERQPLDQDLETIPGLSRGLIQIQTGCNHKCTFCATTIARGSSHSRQISQIVEQVHKFVENGYKEVVFTGVDISDYGKDIDSSLHELISQILLGVPSLPRIRLSSIDVAEIDDSLKQLICNESRIMPHLHLSIQSGNDMILKRMRRRHTAKQVIDFSNEMREARPEMTFGADVIAGFPTESDSMFRDTINTLIKARINYLHIFPYSPKEGTPAARMPQLPIIVRKQRARILKRVGNMLMRRFLESQLDRILSIVVEKSSTGRSENFALVKFKDPQNMLRPKAIAKVKIHGIEGGALLGVVDVS